MDERRLYFVPSPPRTPAIFAFQVTPQLYLNNKRTNQNSLPRLTEEASRGFAKAKDMNFALRGFLPRRFTEDISDIQVTRTVTSIDDTFDAFQEDGVGMENGRVVATDQYGFSITVRPKDVEVRRKCEAKAQRRAERCVLPPPPSSHCAHQWQQVDVVRNLTQASKGHESQTVDP